MELVTNENRIWYFIPDSEDDVPRYAISPLNQLYDEIKILGKEDILKIQPTRMNSDQMAVNFGDKSLGIIEFNDDETEDHLTQFVTQWKNGLKFLALAGEAKVDRKTEEKHKQKIELFKFLCDNLGQYVKPSDISMRVISWNLNGMTKIYENQKEEFRSLLDVNRDIDMYVINLQEIIPLNTLAFYSSPVVVNDWINFVLSVLNGKDVVPKVDGDLASSFSGSLDIRSGVSVSNSEYDYLVDNRLVGLTTIVIIRKSLKKQVSNVEVTTTGNGILNLFGNTGAILSKFTFSYDKDILPYIDSEQDLDRNSIVHGYQFVFVNSHLSNNILKRKKELSMIEKNLSLRKYYTNDSVFLISPGEYGGDPFKFNYDQETIKDNKIISMEDLSLGVTSPKIKSATPPLSPLSIETFSENRSSLYNENFVFFAGDLNFELAGTDIKELVFTSQVDKLVERDTLLMEKAASNIFNGFTEHPITFMPTHKLKTTRGNQLVEELSIDDENLEDISAYNFQQLPNYGGRILYNDTNHVTVNEYNSFNLLYSEHRPVYLDLTLENLQLIDFNERYKLMKEFLKSKDYLENSNKPFADISPIDLKVQDLKILENPKQYEFQITNQGNSRLNWELVNSTKYLQIDTIDNSTTVNENLLKEPLVEIFPTNGVIPAKGVQRVTIKINTISIGIKRILVSLILRIIDSKDFFLTYEFSTRQSLFGESLDLLNTIKGFGSSSGIPPSIYELINYLSNNLHKDMFNDTYDNGPGLKDKLLNELDVSIREQLEVASNLDEQYISKINNLNSENSGSKAVVRTLLLLLNNLDGGIIPKEFSQFILDEIQLPSVFSLVASNKFELQTDITTKVMELLPGLRANVFMYITSFLTLFLTQNPAADKNHLVSLFEESLIKLPADASRGLKSKRREVLKTLL